MADASPSPHLSGRVIRTLELSPRLAHERFWLDTGPRTRHHQSEPRWTELDVIGEGAVAGPSIGPLLMWNEIVGRSENLADLRQRHLGGNLAGWTPPEPIWERDATGADPLPEDDFWSVIHLLKGSLGEKATSTAASALAQHDEDFIMRWQETCALKALELAATLPGLVEDYGIDALHRIGTVIGKGRDVCESFAENWDSWDPRWVTNQSSSVLFLGARALDRKLKHSVRITTSFTPVHWRILHADKRQRAAAQQRFALQEGLGRAEVEAELGTEADAAAIGEFLVKRGADLSAEGLAAVRDAGQPPHLRGLLRNLSMRAGRALIGDGEDIRMRIVLADVTFASDEEIVATLRDALQSFGGVVCSEVEIGTCRYGGPLDSDLFVLKRRFRGTREQYLERYVLP